MMTRNSKFVIGVSLLLNLMIQGGATFTSSMNHHVHNNQRPSIISMTPSQHVLQHLRGGETAAEEVLKPLKAPRFQNMVLTNHPEVRDFFVRTAESCTKGWTAVKDSFYAADVIALVCLVILPIPLARMYHKIFYQIVPIFVPSKEKKEYQRSKISRVGNFAAQGGRIASLVYLVEMASRFILNAAARAPKAAKAAAKSAVPKNLEPLAKFPNFFANIAYGYWIATEVSKAKRRLLRKVYTRLPDPETYDGMFDFLIYITASIIVLDACHFDLGGLVRSLVAVGGLSSIVIGLALKEPVSQMLQGALMMASNKFHRNESIRLGDGTQGKVVDIGLLETTIMGGDDITVKIPHSKMTGQKFSNISRMQRSQAKFELQFHFEDLVRIDDIVQALKEEIRSACPKLITDGSRPFRVMWTDIATNHILVTIDTHHYVPPSSGAYWEARGAVLSAISRALVKTKGKFANGVKISG
ncbi:unnamed protein product [Cylindrotheca closterium]|uniref:Mechanosensitive ion channel MscS domain-containing protein n=1 Tax=Cylindrotheca closterium TaxID=2856 RepID=A0AAD2CVU7_9STRA|nr:unnamed protein product [Cylindrotheca closterium]